MKRTLDDIAGKRFDVVVIGGGINGAFVACDAARRGLSVLIVEKADFGMATSETMSHLVHGGLRYLARGQIGLTRESLRERNRLRRFAPHMIKPQPFLLPVGRRSRLNQTATRAAIRLFEWLGQADGGLDGAEKSQWLSPREAAALDPTLEALPMAGAMLYNDCRVDEPERVVLSIVMDAVHQGAVAANHAEAISLSSRNGMVTGVEIRDALSGAVFPVLASTVVNCAGSTADRLADQLLPGQRLVRFTRSKGIHVITTALSDRFALALSSGGRHAFTVPWKGMTIIGTTDDLFSGGEIRAEASEQEGLIAKLRALLPVAAALPVLASYAGVRALPGAQSSTYGAKRDFVIADHSTEQSAGFFSLYGGKWTTGRLMAERQVDRLVAYLGRSTAACSTTSVPIAGRPEPGTSALPCVAPAVTADMVQSYGSAIEDLATLYPHGEITPLQIEEWCFRHAVEAEMAMTAEDVMNRLGRWRGIADSGLHHRACAWFAARSGHAS